MSDSPIQFDKAEFAADAPATTCAGCSARIIDTYWEANGRLVCASCRTNLEAHGAGETPYAKAVLLALPVAGFGALVWGIAEAKGSFALISIGIGWAISWAIQTATGRRSSRLLQVFAVLLTYLAIASGYAGAYLVAEGIPLSPTNLLLVLPSAIVFPVSSFEPLLWLIIGFGLWEAWRRSAPVRIEVTGPYHLSKREPTPEPPVPQEPASGA